MDVQLYRPTTAERTETTKKRRDSALERPSGINHLLETCSMKGLSKLPFRFMGVGDTRITDGGIASDDDLYSRVQVKSLIMPGPQDRQSKTISDVKNKHYSGMIFIIVAHRYVPDETLKEIGAKLKEDPHWVPDLPIKYAFFFKSVNDVPGPRMSFSERGMERWLPYRVDFDDPQSIADGAEKLAGWVASDPNKLTYDEMLREEDAGMGQPNKVEHRGFLAQLNLFGSGWHVIPNPRKHQGCDVFIIRPDRAVLNVSNKVLAVENRRLKFRSNVPREVHTSVYFTITRDFAKVFLIPPSIAEECEGLVSFSETIRPEIFNNGIDISTEEGKKKVLEKLMAVDTPYTLDDLMMFKFLEPFASLLSEEAEPAVVDSEDDDDSEMQAEDSDGNPNADSESGEENGTLNGSGNRKRSGCQTTPVIRRKNIRRY